MVIKKNILLPIRPLSNIDIMNYYSSDLLFKGVFSRNQLPTKIEKGNYIINLDDNTGPGTHWVAVSNVLKDKCVYFDSFGVYIPEEVVKFMKTSGKEIIRNMYRIQAKKSVMCGYYCIDFFNNVKRFTDWLLDFDPKNYSKNDWIVKKHLNLI